MKTQLKNILIVFTSVVLVYCSKDDNAQPEVKNSEKEITSFIFKTEENGTLDQDAIGNIDQNNKKITVSVPYDTDVTVLKPTIEISEDATISPIGAQDYTNSVIYTITAQNGFKTTYTVNVLITPKVLSGENQLLRFDFETANNSQLSNNIQGIIDQTNGEVTITVPNGTDITALTPTIEISELASISPTGTQDYTNAVIYTVTAENDAYLQYVVSVKTEVNLDDQRNALIAIYNANPNNSLGWDLNDTDVSNWNGVIVDTNGYITTLGINSKDITVLPPEIGQLTTLTKLFINNNQLTTLPPEIRKLTNLIELYANYNEITTIPIEIGNLTDLNYLLLDENQLTTIPSEIGQLSKLTVLNISFNQFASIVAEISSLTSLENLFINNNELTSVPLEIGQLKTLKSLQLQNNKLTSIPVEIGNLANLNYLYLENNQLTSIPQVVCDLETNHGTTITVDSGVMCQ